MNGSTVDDVKFVDNGIVLDISEPTTMPNMSKSKRLYIKDEFMLKILSRYIDNETEDNTSNDIQDAVY